MLSNYLKIAGRNLRKQPGFTLINVFGLAAGLTCFGLIALWVSDELSYDRFNQHYAQIVRVTSVEKTPTGRIESALSPAPMAAALRKNYAEVAGAVRFNWHREEIVQYKNRQTLQPDILLTDPSFFTVFSYGLTQGNKATALQDPYSIILTESTAKKYFGNADPMGQVLTIFMYDSTSRGANYTVTGITPDPPRTAHFSFTMLASFSTIEQAKPALRTAEGWSENRFYTYLLLQKGIDHRAFSAKMAHFLANSVGKRADPAGTTYSYQLQPLGDIHLRSQLDHEIAPTGRIDQVYIFSTIGLFILLLAGMNYTNLTTARSVGRAKEVGIHKVVGARRGELIRQYLTEAVLLALLALLLSGLMAIAVQPFLQSITGKPLSLVSSPAVLLLLTGVALLVGILSGLYPAFVLSAFKPAHVLKGQWQSGTKGIRLRQSLVVAQFVITLILLTGIVIIDAQMRYVSHKDLGYDKDALLFIRVNGNSDVVAGYGAFKDELTANPLIKGVATSNSLIVNGLETGSAQTVDRQNHPIQVTTSQLEVDADYPAVYGLTLIAGRSFTPAASRDTLQSILLNERAVKQVGWKNAGDAIGKPFTLSGRPGTVIGVVRDFHFNSLQHAIEPLALYPRANWFSRITVRLDPRQASQCLASLETSWASHFPHALFDYDFIDRQLAQNYQTQERFSTLIFFFSVLSLLIACLGLYGLIAHSTAQRRKEVGIRKTLGATVSSLTLLLAKDYLKLVILASMIALPVAAYLMQQWLQDFAYRIDLSWWMFATSVLSVLFVASLTVSFETIKAALMNPVKSLRSE